MVTEGALRLKDLLAASRARPLEDAERREFEKLRRGLSDGYALAQRLTLPPGQLQRRSRRVAHLLKATVRGHGFTETTATMNLSSGGFAALLAEAHTRGEHVEFTLHTRLGQLEGRARVVSAVRRERSWLTSFAIDEMRDTDRNALDELVLEQVVAALTRTNRPR